ncbi:MAG: hypothetical protein NC911_03240 [Candidatus Omnitrophica bacterium]|nr:hypothetical protein [Candidatus Omnitrophota bacterium]
MKRWGWMMSVLAPVIFWGIVEGAPEKLKGQDRKPGNFSQNRLQALGLTEAQKEQLHLLLQKNKEQFQAIAGDSSLTAAEKQEKMKVLRESLKEELAQILSPDQLEKWKEMQPSFKRTAKQERLTELFGQLGLTPEQEEKVKTILQKQRDELKDILQDPSLTDQEKKEKIRSFRLQQGLVFKEVLTPEQWQKFQELRREKLKSLKKIDQKE